MCGIAGIIDFRGRPIDREALQRMQASLAHRGPDDEGLWIRENEGFSVGLAHTRLAVIDPTPEAHQPMTDPADRWAIAYNGELYNYRALSQALPDPLLTASDTEVVLRACMAWGPSAVQRFDAMWALAVVDRVGRCGHLSRDPMGIKPLYYAIRDHRLIFASEMRTLRLYPGLDADIDPEARDLYLRLGFIPAPWTIFKDIRKLPPGHQLIFDAHGPREPQRYHHLPAPDPTPLPYSDACRQLRETITQAVQRQTVADVPLGAFLSGGLDSAVTVACLAGHGRTVKTFSIGYQDHPRYDETSHAELVARHFGTEHHAFRLSFRDILATVEPMLARLGEPFADSSLLPTAMVSEQTRRHVTVALSGDGGDELFGGYWRYLGHHYLERYHRIPGPLRRGIIEPLLRLTPAARTTPLLDRFRQARKLLRGDRPDPIERHLAWASLAEPHVAADLLGMERAAAADARLWDLYKQAGSALRDGLEPPTAMDRILLADLAIGLPGDMLHKVDLASMAHSLEVRVPLLSTDVVAFSAALPVEYKLTGTTTKRILRDAFRDVLPAPILSRAKMGFEVPVGEFLRRELREMYQGTVTNDRLEGLGLNAQSAGGLFDAHLHRRADHTELLWALLVLCDWQSRSAGRS